MSCRLFFPFCPIMLNLLHTEFVAMFLSMMRTDSAAVAPSRALRKKTYRRHITNNNYPLAASCLDWKQKFLAGSSGCRFSRAGSNNISRGAQAFIFHHVRITGDHRELLSAVHKRLQLGLMRSCMEVLQLVLLLSFQLTYLPCCAEEADVHFSNHSSCRAGY